MPLNQSCHKSAFLFAFISFFFVYARSTTSLSVYWSVGRSARLSVINTVSYITYSVALFLSFTNVLSDLMTENS